MNPRLQQLQTQRALMARHLQWLDEEIASEKARVALAPEAELGVEVAPEVAAGSSSSPSARLQVPTHTTAAAVVSIEAKKTGLEFSRADEIGLETPAVDPLAVHESVRRGCLIYAAIASGGLAALVGYIYWHY